MSVLMAASVLSSCSKSAPHGEQPNAAPAIADVGSATPRGPVLVRVDPSLVSNGRVELAPALRRGLRGDVRVPAEAVPSESGAADIGALVAGRIATIDVREGESVKRGQVLATLDSPEAARIVADTIRARARLLAATRRLDRQKGLEEDRATSAMAVDEARMELETARADVAASRTLLTSLGAPEPPAAGDGPLASRVSIRSPIDGVLVERMIAIGAPVSPDKTLFRVIASDRVVVFARWTDPSTPPPPGSTTTLFPRGGDSRASCPSHVAATLAVIDDKTRARRIRIVPDGPCAFLAPGAFVDASFTSMASDASIAVVVPKGAVVDVRGAPTVFVAHGNDGVLSARVVRVGRTTSEDVAIEDGLAEGESVAITGSVLLKGELLRGELESP